MSAAIRTEKLGKTYFSGFFRFPYLALANLDLDVPEGSSFGFVGPNGAGKTTAIKTLMGLQRPTAGAGWIHGVSILDPASRARVGFLPERPYFYEHLTAREFLDFYARLGDVPSAERGPRIASLLERVDLARFRDVPLGKFSKGMLQRAGLAQALIADPSLLVLDEPMSGLDPIGRALVRDLIIEERREGKTVFFSSHILSDIEAICDRVAMIVRGELRGQGKVTDLVASAVQHVDVVVRKGDAVETRKADPGGVDAVIDAARGGGWSIVSVHAVSKSLEQVLLDEVERARPVDAKRLGVLA
jgi:ABC-2 type transport system ATP-binding protein